MPTAAERAFREYKADTPTDAPAAETPNVVITTPLKAKVPGSEGKCQKILIAIIVLLSCGLVATSTLAWMWGRRLQTCSATIPSSSTALSPSTLSHHDMTKRYRHQPLRNNITTGYHVAAGRRLSDSATLEGAAFADYSVPIVVGSQTFECIVDSGSSNFAIAASSNAGVCSNYYSGTCGSPATSASYGSGSWEGGTCTGAQISIGGVSAGEPAFAGITTQTNFLSDCDSAECDLPPHKIR